MGKFVIKQTKSGGYNFSLKATNGQVIAVGQTYKRAANCKIGIASIQKNAPIALVEDQTEEGYKVLKHPKFEVYTDSAGETRFRLKAANGQIIATGEGYTTRKACLNGIESIRKNAPDAAIEME